MSKPNNNNFKNILKEIKGFDIAFGIFLFKDPAIKKTKLEKLLSTTWPSHVLIVSVFIISTVIITNFALINVILSCSAISILTGMYSALTKMIKKKNVVLNYMKWCEDLYDIEKSFVKIARDPAVKHLMSVEKKILMILVGMRNIFYIDAFFSSIGAVLIGMMLPESIFPKFTLPAPFYLPFKDQRTWHAYITTVLLQAKFVFDTAPLISLVFGIFFCISLHILGYLDIIKDVVEQMKIDLIMNFEGLQVEKPKNYLKLAEINESAYRKLNENSFNECIINITEMISNVNSLVTSISNFYEELFLLTEISSLGSLFLCGLSYIIVHQHLIFASGTLFPVILLFCICFINEKILDGLGNIKEALYDLPWYKLDLKQKKLLLIAMNCDNVQRGFTALKIHDLTMERFGIVLKAGYTNLLVLKDLILK